MQEYKNINEQINKVNSLKKYLMKDVSQKEIRKKLIMLTLSSFLLGNITKNKIDSLDSISLYEENDKNIFSQSATLNSINNAEGIYVYGEFEKYELKYARDLSIYSLENINETNLNDFLNSKSVDEMLTYLSIETSYKQTVDNKYLALLFAEKNATIKINGTHYDLESKKEVNILKIDLFILTCMQILSIFSATYLFSESTKELIIYNNQSKIKSSRYYIISVINNTFKSIENDLDDLENFDENEINEVVTKLINFGVLSSDIDDIPTIDNLRNLIRELREISDSNKKILQTYLYNDCDNYLETYPIERKIK